MPRSIYHALMRRWAPDRTFSPERRAAIRAMLAAGAGAALAGCARVGDKPAGHDAARTDGPALRGDGPRVVVIGAGLAGLACAHELRLAGADPVVLEARGRVGGRVLTFRDWFPGTPIEGGGELIGANHDHWLRHAARFGLEFDDVVELDLEAPIRIDGAVLTAEESESLWREMDDAVSGMNELARRIDAEQPWRSPDAERLDRTTVRQWIDSLNCSDLCKRALAAQLSADNAVDVSRQSLLAHLAMVKGGGLERFWTESEVFRCRQGNDALAARLASDLGERRLRLRSPVVRVESGARGVRVHASPDGRPETFFADAVVAAVPAAVLRDIAFDPPLPDALVAQTGPAVKRLTRTTRRAWLDHHRSPDSLSDAEVSMTWEPTSSTDAPVDQPACLTAFSGGNAAQSLRALTATDRDRTIRAQLEALYPGVADAERDAKWMDWPSEAFIRTGYAFPAPGELTTIGSLWQKAAADGQVWFAGEHTSPAFMGYMEGALASGASAARRLMARASPSQGSGAE